MLGITTLAMIALHGPVLTNIRVSARKMPRKTTGVERASRPTSTNGIDASMARPGTRNRARGLVFDRRSATRPPIVMPTTAAASVTRPRSRPAFPCSMPLVLIRKSGTQTSMPPMAKV